MRCCARRRTSGSSPSSREALRVPGEQIYPVLPLAVPDPTASVETLSRFEAVQLFMDRAQLQKPGFTLNEKKPRGRRARARASRAFRSRWSWRPRGCDRCPIQEINKRLHNRFTLLTGGGRVLLERQQTLRALVAWSYDMLTDNEKLLFDRLGVFVGGFDLPAAEAICGADPLMPEDVLDLVTLARRQVARHGPRNGRRIALPNAGDAPRVRARGPGQARRAGGDRDAALRSLSRGGEGLEQGDAGIRPGRMDPTCRSGLRQHARRDKRLRSAAAWIPSSRSSSRLH